MLVVFTWKGSLGLGLQLTSYICFFLVAVIKHNEQRQIMEERVILAEGSWCVGVEVRGRSVAVGEAYSRLLEQEAGRPWFQLQTKNRE